MSYTDEEYYFGKKMMHIVIEPKKLTCDTVNSLIATTSRKRPPPVSDHFLNSRFASQSNTVSKTLS